MFAQKKQKVEGAERLGLLIQDGLIQIAASVGDKKGEFEISTSRYLEFTNKGRWRIDAIGIALLGLAKGRVNLVAEWVAEVMKNSAGKGKSEVLRLFAQRLDCPVELLAAIDEAQELGTNVTEIAKALRKGELPK